MFAVCLTAPKPLLKNDLLYEERICSKKLIPYKVDLFSEVVQIDRVVSPENVQFLLNQTQCLITLNLSKFK